VKGRIYTHIETDEVIEISMVHSNLFFGDTLYSVYNHLGRLHIGNRYLTIPCSKGRVWILKKDLRKQFRYVGKL